MPKKVGTAQWRKQRSKEYLEKKEYRYYIFCEGEQTEPLYFEGFKRLIEDNPIYKDMVLIEIEPCAAETMRVIGMAERYVRKSEIDRGQIWCVYDKDCFPAKDFNGVTERVDKLNFENPEYSIMRRGAMSVSSFGLFCISLIILQTILDQSISSFSMINLESWELRSIKRI